MDAGGDGKITIKFAWPKRAVGVESYRDWFWGNIVHAVGIR